MNCAFPKHQRDKYNEFILKTPQILKVTIKETFPLSYYFMWREKQQDGLTNEARAQSDVGYVNKQRQGGHDSQRRVRHRVDRLLLRSVQRQKESGCQVRK